MERFERVTEKTVRVALPVIAIYFAMHLLAYFIAR